MGGEKGSGDADQLADAGSPPRGRGKVDDQGDVDDCHGITPAWAGKRLKNEQTGHFHWDHPRVGGEKLTSTLKKALPRGSPPRGRGKDHPIQGRKKFKGITPAWAGKSLKQGFFDIAFKDHPRVGGEKSAPTYSLNLVGGSPPRGRGKGLQLCIMQPDDRITPAWAGKSSPPAGGTTPNWDHPRVGGEKRNTFHRNNRR